MTRLFIKHLITCNISCALKALAKAEIKVMEVGLLRGQLRGGE